jgi:CheY-like chemotaxis protein
MTTALAPAVVQAGTAGSVLVVDDDLVIVRLVEQSLLRAGYRVTTALSASRALELLEQAVPDVIVSDVDMPGINGFELVRRLRSHPALRGVPLLFLTSRGGTEDVVQGIDLGADDYITKPFRPAELVARVEAKVHRPPVPIDRLRTDRRSGLASAAAFQDDMERERERAGRSGRPGFVAVVGVHETESVRRRFGDRGVDELHRRMGEALALEVTALETAGRTADGGFALLLPETDAVSVQRRLQALAEQLARTPLSVAGDRISVTPLSGFTGLESGDDAVAALQQAQRAVEHAAVHLDLQPVRFTPQMALSRASGARPAPAGRRAGPGGAAAHPVADRAHGRHRHGAAVPPLLDHRPGRLPGRTGGVPRRRRGAAGHRDVDLRRGPARAGRAAPAAVPAGAGRDARLPAGQRGDRGVPAERGGHRRRDGRGVPAGALPRAAAGGAGLQHPARPARRGGAARARRARRPAAAACAWRAAPPRRRTSTPR